LNIAKTALLLAIVALASAVVGWGTPGASPTHVKLTLNFSSSGTPSKYSLDAESSVVNGLTNTIIRQGQFPNGVYLIVFYVWCDTTVSGGSVILQQTGATGWSYTFACGTGQSSAGDPGAISGLFSQNLLNVNNYDIVYSNSNAVADTMQAGFVVSSTVTETQAQIPGGALYILSLFQIQLGQTVHVWYETGSAPSCTAGTLVCYIGILEVLGGRSCKLDLSGGSTTSSGTPDSTTEVCTMTPASSGLQLNFRVVVVNTDTTVRQISGLFLISIY